MKYITVTFDLTEEDYESENVDNLEKFLEEKGFGFETKNGEVPSTSVVMEDNGIDIESLKEEIVEFCLANEIGLANLLVTGAAPVSQYVSQEFTDHDH